MISADLFLSSYCDGLGWVRNLNHQVANLNFRLLVRYRQHSTMSAVTGLDVKFSVLTQTIIHSLVLWLIPLNR